MEETLFGGVKLRIDEKTEGGITIGPKKRNYHGGINDIIKELAKDLSTLTPQAIVGMVSKEPARYTYPKGLDISAYVFVTVNLTLEGANGWHQVGMEWNLDGRVSLFSNPEAPHLTKKRPSHNYATTGRVPYILITKVGNKYLGVRSSVILRVWGNGIERILRGPRHSPLIPWTQRSLSAYKREVKHMSEAVHMVLEMAEGTRRDLITLAFRELWEKKHLPDERFAHVIAMTSDPKKTWELVDKILKKADEIGDFVRQVYALFTRKKRIPFLILTKTIYFTFSKDRS